MTKKNDSDEVPSRVYVIVEARNTKKIKVELEKAKLISKTTKIMNAPNHLLNFKLDRHTTICKNKTLDDLLNKLDIRHFKWIPTESTKLTDEFIQTQLFSFGTTISCSASHCLVYFEPGDAGPINTNRTAYTPIQHPLLFSCLAKSYIIEIKSNEPVADCSEYRKRLPDSPFVTLVNLTRKWWQEFLLNKKDSLINIDGLVSSLPIKWEQYGGFALLPQGSFEGEEWHIAFESLVPEEYPGVREAALDFFEKVVASALSANHLARKVSIPAGDILRRPKVTPLFGKQWDPVSLLNPESERCVNNIFWAQVRQNAHYYIWSPLHTMFSAGNITEKARITLQNPVFNSTDNIVVDLYGGIGYFTFPYLIHANARLVYACEWNPWSVLGLIQGALRNRIPFELSDIHQNKYLDNFKIIQDHCPPQHQFYLEDKPKDSQLVICPGNNEDYVCLFKNKAHHVNLGLIPSSSQGYPLAVQAINDETGGYLHIHENVNDDLLKETKFEVAGKISGLFKLLRPEREWLIEPCDHVEVVKSYGPHIYHVVFDVFCSPLPKN